MDQLGCKRYCCRRMVMTHVDLIEKLLRYIEGMRWPKTRRDANYSIGITLRNERKPRRRPKSKNFSYDPYELDCKI